MMGTMETEHDTDHESAQCPYCEADAPLLGGLGSVLWYRCRDCGLTFCSSAKADHEAA